jgi:hypothetical protein
MGNTRVNPILVALLVGHWAFLPTDVMIDPRGGFLG